MIHPSVLLLCTAGMFLTLLTDRFRSWVTAAGCGGLYLLALVLALVLRGKGGPLAPYLPGLVGGGVFFLGSLFLFVDPPLQQLFVAGLSVVTAAAAELFIPLFLDALPFSVAGGLGGFLTVLFFLLWTLLIVLFLYHPLRHFSDRGASAFLVGMCLLLAVLGLILDGRADFLFRGNVPAQRLLLTALCYALLLFSFRRVYHAGRFRARTDAQLSRIRLMELEQDNISDLHAALREVRSARMESGYALDTVATLLTAGDTRGIAEYIVTAKENLQRSPALETFHTDPVLNAVIAMKAAFARQNDIAFSCNAVVDGTPLSPDEICVITREILARACRDAAAFSGERRVRFTAFPSPDSLAFEAVYSAEAPKKRRSSVRGKTLSQVWRQLFEEPDRGGDLAGLELTQEIIGLHSGSLTLSASGTEQILQAKLRF